MKKITTTALVTLGLLTSVGSATLNAGMFSMPSMSMPTMTSKDDNKTKYDTNQATITIPSIPKVPTVTIRHAE
ncbi:MAG: hypothetical protein GQ570_12105 [Helicobacteraceae bacterium]|nr:hypothetical protein [Helicobacteraceae bacterium]